MGRKQSGLTLVELMVVVAVMAIIASVAYPLYTSQTQKSRRADAKIALKAIALAQERYFTVNGEYGATLSTLDVAPAIQGGTSNQGYYNLTLTRSGADNEQFSATATRSTTGAQASDSNCVSFTINQLGVETATNTNCW